MDSQKIDLCSRILQRDNIGTLDGFPYRQGKNGVVCFVKNKQQDLVLKIPNSWMKREKEVYRLNRLQRLTLDSAEVPNLVSVRRFPSYILMSKVSGQTCREKWEQDRPPSPKEVRNTGTALGKFLAELYKKTGGIYSDLHLDNVLLGQDGQVKIVDWAKRLKRSPAVAFLHLISCPYNLAPPTAAAFTDSTGVVIDLGPIAARAMEKHPELAPDITANLREWKEVMLKPAQVRFRQKLLAKLGGRHNPSGSRMQIG